MDKYSNRQTDRLKYVATINLWLFTIKWDRMHFALKATKFHNILWPIEVYADWHTKPSNWSLSFILIRAFDQFLQYFSGHIQKKKKNHISKGQQTATPKDLVIHNSQTSLALHCDINQTPPYKNPPGGGLLAYGKGNTSCSYSE